MVNLYIQDYYVKIDSSRNHGENKFELQLYQENKNAAHSIKDILEYGTKYDRSGFPLYPNITSLNLIGVLLQPEDITPLITFITEKKIKQLFIERVSLYPDTISALLMGLQNASHLQSLFIKSIGLNTQDHAIMLNRLFEFHPSLARIEIKDSQFDSNVIDGTLLNLSKIYQNAIQYLSLLSETEDLNTLPICKENFYKEMKVYYDAFEKCIATKSKKEIYQKFYNESLANAFFIIGKKYQDFALPQTANDYFKRVIDSTTCSSLIKDQALTLYALNKYAEGCQQIAEKNHRASIVPISQAIEAMLSTKNDDLLIERAHTSLCTSINETKKERESLSPLSKRRKR